MQSGGAPTEAAAAESPSFIVGLGPSDAPRACEFPSPSSAQFNDRGGQAPALRARGHRLLVGRSRGTGPRATGPGAPSSRWTIAGDRPPRYGHIETGRSLLPYCIETRRSLLRGFMKHPHNRTKFGGLIQDFFAFACAFSNSTAASGSGIPRICN